MTPPPAQDEDSYDKVERLLGELQMKHFELAGMIGEYRDMMADLRDRHDAEKVKLARVLPGAKYFVQTEYVRQTWLVVGVELKRIFPEEG